MRTTSVRLEKGTDGVIELQHEGTMVLLRKIAAHETMATGYRITLASVLRRLIRLEAKRLGVLGEPETETAGREGER